MTHPSPDQPEPERALWGRAERKRARIRAEIQRNRAGGPHKIPTWVLAVVLGVILLGWLALIVTS